MSIYGMTDLRKKRRSIELSHLEAWLHQGRGSFHFENVEWIPVVVRNVLRFSGLLERGERNARSPVLKRLTFSFPDLPPAFDGLRLLHLSDIHADGLHGLPEAIVSLIADLEYDVCVLTGDYRFEIHGPCHNVYHHMRTILAAVRAPLGIYGILGNHDFIEEAEEFENMGVRMLINESVEIRRDDQSLWLAGLDDPHYYGCDDLPGALRGVPPDAFKILLVHTPEIIPEAAAAGISLYLCGHTHGGQICFPLIGPVLLNASCARRYARGRWSYGRVQGYTSNGIGSSGVPVRFLCPPEAVLIELKREITEQTE